MTPTRPATGEVETRLRGEIRRRLVERYREIDGQTLHRLAEGGLTWLRANQAGVNALNVYPVPDNDTGTNMVLTMESALQEASANRVRSVGQVAQKLAYGALMGARGNSGVILSNLFGGFSRALANLEQAGAADFARAFGAARDTAYRAVPKPVEGTILTVAKDIAEAAESAVQGRTLSTFELLEELVGAADQSVQRTPELLEILRQAKVVDAGGKGLFFLLEGALRTIYGLPLDQPVISIQPLSEVDRKRAQEMIEPGQDWEVVADLLPGESFTLPALHEQLSERGTSIQIGEGEGLYRIHIHVPLGSEYATVDYLRSLGTVTVVRLENLLAQVAGTQAGSASPHRPAPLQPGQIAVVAVAPGQGLARVFSSLGANALLEGGQAMNPSTAEILRSFENLPTDQVILLPNNKNILLAARQAAELTVKHVAVVPSTSVPQGLAAMLAHRPDGDFDPTVREMTQALTHVRTAEITTATRSVEVDGVSVREGQLIGLVEGRLVIAADGIAEATGATLDRAGAADAELITLYYGADLGPRQANEIADQVRARWAEATVEVHEGGQPLFPLIISVE
jgi:DAK2 domain fusion protein YloV